MEFDGWTVNRISGEIEHAGRISRLAQQPLRILVELFDHAGEVVTREQLVKALWPAGVVDFDNGLNVAVRKLRVALDDVGDTPRYIETLPKVGYRFIGKVGGAGSVVGSAAASAPAAPALAAAAALAAAPVPAAAAASSGRRSRWAIGLAAVAVVIAITAIWWQHAQSPRASHHVPSARAQELYVEGMHERSRR